MDEAHCVSQWGQDFRPSYLRIRAFIESLPKRPVVGAFTATATEEVQADIVKLLNLQDPFRMTTGFDRPNLRFEVRTPHKKDSELLDILAEMRDRSGIVYCSTRKNVEEVCSLLCANGYAATRYHAGLGDAERRDNQDDFLYDRKTVMVATNAFGMGIDKSNVGFVIHYNMPKNLESYYQEAGRAGRDGSDAVCILLYSPQDVFTNNLLIERESDNPELSPKEAAAVKEKLRLGLRRMTQYCTTTGCLRSDMLRYFGEQARDFCGNCSNCSAEYREEDATQAARAILECVMELRQRFGRTVVSEVVRGRKTARIAKLGLDQCRSFGVLQGQDEREIRSLMDTMTEKNLLAADGSEYPVVRLGAEAKDFLDDGLAISRPYSRGCSAEGCGCGGFTQNDKAETRRGSRGWKPIAGRFAQAPPSAGSARTCAGLHHLLRCDAARYVRKKARNPGRIPSGFGRGGAQAQSLRQSVSGGNSETPARAEPIAVSR